MKEPSFPMPKPLSPEKVVEATAVNIQDGVMKTVQGIRGFLVHIDAALNATDKEKVFAMMGEDRDFYEKKLDIARQLAELE